MSILVQFSGKLHSWYWVSPIANLAGKLWSILISAVLVKQVDEATNHP
ncbi:MAG TPA: hypothetical protein VFD70_08160 [Anaerolineae bacterium]|nr:hypothetical protein [Anaerolineae bacterium]